MPQELLTTHLCMTKDIGVHGNLFGGNMLSWLDEAAASMASQVCDTTNLVTKKLTEVEFERRIRVGQLIKIYGEVTRLGNTSITLAIEARKHNVHTGTQKKVCSTRITFVNVDEEGEPLPHSDRVKERFEKSKEGEEPLLNAQ
ncbi:MAG: acyl-CoA thioesterase [Flavobacteriales bacterium]